jgi:hypothetical protein
VIAFIRITDKQMELWAANRDGSGLRRLVSATQVAAVGSHNSEAHNVISLGSWISGTHQLVYSIYWSIDRIGGCCTTVGYWRIDADTLASRRWPAPRMPGGLLSPDGKRLAIVGPSSLSLANADRSHRQDNVLTYPNGPYEGDAWLYSLPLVWSPDSQYLLAVVPSPEPYASDETLNIWRIPANASTAERLASFPGMPAQDTFSPNQAYLAYIQPVEPQSNEWELHLAKVDGTATVAYTTAYALQFFGWSPNSIHFAYGAYFQAQIGSICGASMPVNGVSLSDRVHWIDDSRFLFVGGNEQHPHELWLGEIGQPSTRIGAFSGDQAQYAVGPDTAH